MEREEDWFAIVLPGLEMQVGIAWCNLEAVYWVSAA